MSVPKILMMVGNDIRHDTRVLKSALALADGGAEVTVLGFSPEGHQYETRYGQVRIIRVPVPFRLRNKAYARRKQILESRRLPGQPTPRDMRIRALERGLRRAEAKELGGTSSKVRAVLRGRGDKVRDRVEEVVAKASAREGDWRAKFVKWQGDQTLGASWRRDLPEIDDYELAYAPVIDSLEWDALHVHDVHHVGTAARAVARRRAKGEEAVWVYDSHEYVVGLPVYPPRTQRFVAASADLESEFIHRADAVITVTEPLADQLRVQYKLPVTPTVVMNAPQLDTEVTLTGPGVREVVGLADDVPLLVYSGGVTPARGVQTVVEALPQLPDVHLAVVCVPSNRTTNVGVLRKLGEELGVSDRLHLLDPVAPAEVSRFLESADVGVHPLVHFGGHEFALPNKLFEYLHAGLPLVVSDCRALAAFVRTENVGGVFIAEDPESCAATIRDVLERREVVAKRIADDPHLLDPYRWERQAAKLRELYRQLLPDATITEPDHETPLQSVREQVPTRDDRPSVVCIGPANMAGQGWEWAKALERNIPGVGTHVMVVDRGQPYRYPDDEFVEVTKYRRNAQWAQTFENRALAEWTHALFESGRPLFGLRHGDTFVGDAKVLRAAGVRVGMLLHGSEVRNPTINVMQTPWSPFTARIDEQTMRLQTQVDKLVPELRAFMSDEQYGGPVFVSTPDLLRHLPGAIWLPVVVDAEKWAYDGPLLEREVPVVFHAPSRSSLKGSSHVETALAPLVAEGLVEYRRVEGVAPEEMVGLVKDADIVLDQFALGLYGVAACEAMMAGRLVLSHITDEVRGVVRDDTGLDVPIVEAPADTLEAVLREVLTERDRYREIASHGPGFVREVHDGRRSAAVLAEHLNIHG